jgi:endonuclease/exonuclease/phosphatase family metal-dependent hydrolase
MRSARLLFALFALACNRLEPMIAPGESCRRTILQDGDGILPPAVDWTEAPDTADRRVLDYWCETVGGAVLDPKPAVRDTGDIVVDSVAIVSWNTHVGGADIERFVRDLRAGRFSNGDSIHHFVLLLQEVFRAGDSVPARTRVAVPDRIAGQPPGSTRRDIVETAARLGLALLYVPSMRNGPTGPDVPREDRAILSTFELEDWRAIELPFEIQRRVAVVAEVDLETADGQDWDLALVSVHLDTRSRVRRLPASAGAGRLRQARVLIAELDDEELIAMGGDFNTWAPDYFEQALPYLRGAFTDSPEPPDQHTFQSRGIRRRLDYLFFRLPDDWRASYNRIDAQYGSDHYPLLGWIHAPPQPASRSSAPRR